MTKKTNRPGEEIAITTNRYVFNRLYKLQLAQHRKIHCSYCKYHRGENDKRKYYGSTFSFAAKKMTDDPIRYPNWKLTTKKSKQWMSETYAVEKKWSRISRREWIELKF